MDLYVYIQLIFLCVLNITFIFSGIILNTLVIASIWKSSQLRKKLCHFMIMVLSCVDLIAVVASHPAILLFVISWLIDDHHLSMKLWFYLHFTDVIIGFSFCVLLVMSIERYLGAYYPIFHRTSVTRRRLLTILSLMLIFHITLSAICTIGKVISLNVVFIIYIIAISLPLVYFNLKLFKISREVRRKNPAKLEKRTTLNLKSISSCLLVVACLVMLTICTSTYLVFDNVFENKHATSLKPSTIWTETLYSINCTINSLIFFWKNKILRAEGMKILKTLFCSNYSSSKQAQKF